MVPGGIPVAELKEMPVLMQEVEPSSDFTLFPFHRTQLLFPIDRAPALLRVTGAFELDPVLVKLLLVTTTYDQLSTVILPT